MSWLGKQLNECHLFRRIILVFVMAMVWRVTEWSFAYANAATNSGTDIAIVIAALTAPVTALMGYSFKLYSESRKNV